MYRIDRAAGTGSPFAGNTGFGRQFLFELIVHVEHIAGANDVALADFNRRRMHHRPGGFGGGAGKYALAARKGGFVTGGAVGFTGLEDEGGLAVEADVFGNGFGVAQVGEEWEGDGRCNRRSGRGCPAEIGEGTDYIEVAVFTGDFIECHGGLLLLGVGRLKSRTCVRAYRTHPTSGLEVSYGVRLALLINSKCFNIFFNIYSFLF